uniref:Putative secreted protein n=1 Tax=Anopheles triannulatus TaxID=58253 RepID=A0A2M4B3A5_9DIPT
MAWSSPSPLVAEVLNIWNVLFFSASSPSAWCTSATLMQPSISCLFASTTSIAPASSSSLSMYNSSSFDMPILSLSAESTTYMIASVLL